MKLLPTFLSSLAAVATTNTASSAPVPLIIDTDMDFDVDDVAAVCSAHALQDRGEAEILAIVHNTGYPGGIGAVSVLNHYYGRDDILLGAFKGDFGATRISKNTFHN